MTSSLILPITKHGFKANARRFHLMTPSGLRSKIGVGVAIGIGIERKLLDRIVAMLTKLGGRGYAVHEVPAEYATRLDSDTDPDTDTDGEHELTDRQPLPGGDA